MTPFAWFQTLYGESSHGWLTLCHKRDAATRSTPDDRFETVWCPAQDLERAGEQAAALARTANVYFGVGLRRTRLADGQRGASLDVGVLPGLWCELDVKNGAFESKEEALALLDSLPFKPTMVIDSGHGLHCYWLFKEPWAFDPDEQEYAAALEHGWHSLISRRAAPRTVDGVQDLARVLRVVGTQNRKNGEVLPVSVLRDDGLRYNPSDFDEWQEWATLPTVTLPNVTVRLGQGVQPPADKFQVLARNDNLWTPAWNETAKNITDQSPSGYAMRLANIAIRAGWSDQEVCDLLIAFREKKPRGNQKGAWWYSTTIAKARAGMTAETSTLARIQETPEQDEKLAGLSTLLGFPVRRFVKRRAVDPSGYIIPAWYVIETDTGNVDIPDAETMHSLSKMKAIVFDRLDRQLKLKPKDWVTVLDALLAVMVTEEAPVESTEYEEIRSALAEYIRSKGTCADPARVHEGEYLAELDDRLWFSLRKFGEWCRIVKRMHVGPRNLPKLLEAVGCTRRTLENVQSGGKRTRTVIWSAPENPLYREKK